MKKPETTTIEIKKLQRIAEYYQFPLAAFFAPTSFFGKGKTRRDSMLKKALKFKVEVQSLCDRYWGEK